MGFVTEPIELIIIALLPQLLANPNPNPNPIPNPNPDPNQVIIIAFLPQLLENRCVSNCREFAKEMGFY